MSEIIAAGLAAQLIPPIATRGGKGTELMPDWAWMVAGVSAYLFLTQWLLLKLGIPT